MKNFYYDYYYEHFEKGEFNKFMQEVETNDKLQKEILIDTIKEWYERTDNRTVTTFYVNGKKVKDTFTNLKDFEKFRFCIYGTEYIDGTTDYQRVMLYD